MNDREAQEIVRMIESNWQMDLSTARGMWRDELMQYEVDLAMKAVAYLAKRASFKPRLSDLSQVLSMYSRNQREDARRAADAKAIEQGKRGFATPEWVWIWCWCRWYRDPKEWRYFPQQDAHPTETMPMADYEALREEWKAAGSPKEKMKAVTRSVVREPVTA